MHDTGEDDDFELGLGKGFPGVVGSVGDLDVAPAWLPKLSDSLRDGVGTFFRKGARAEDGYAHVTDLSGMCYREVWANRNGVAEQEWDYTSMVRMDLGTALEPWLLERLETCYIEENFDIHHQVRLSAWMEGDKLSGGLRVLEPKDGRQVVRGTLDALYIRKDNPNQQCVIDIKTGANVADKYQYRLQVSLYGLLTQSPVVGLLYFSRMDGKLFAPQWWNPEMYREELTQRFKQVTMFTAPGNPEPTTFLPNPWTWIPGNKTRPSYSWACGQPGKADTKPSYCNYISCERNNRNPANQ